MYQKENTLGYLLGFLRDEWSTNWNNSITIAKKEHDPDDYLEMAEKCITGYYNQYKPFNQGRTMGLEERIFVNLDDFKLWGYIDRLTEMENGCYEIHDYKTCSRLPSLEAIQNDRQLGLYSIGVKQRYPNAKDIRLIWHFLAFDKEIESARTDEEFEELKNDTIQLIDTIESAEEFPVNPSRLCDWCKFKTLCRPWSYYHRA